ncbi:MAG: M67 family metallopeptidase [Sphingomonadales bacterium]|uniref:Mov34/MPN/PAD-1 family protein n=2 Tax=Sphingorhabdus sp. TaxID=1902408 RepID=UPI003BAEFBE7|nr:M67 family metallopeptidase [Sphingomonadales bacterium]MBK9431609.1 M67 family metallopeptidase [Sphingomonadales bacterium]
MTLILSRQHRRQLLDFAEESGSSECCGLILGRGDTVELLELTANVAASPYNSFEIDSSMLIRAEKCAREGGLEILGYFHSHPNGSIEPSKIDARSAAADGRCWLIIAGAEISAWRAVERGGRQATFFVPEILVET